MKTNAEMSMKPGECTIIAEKGCLEFLDLSYLPDPVHERQRIDLYLPEGRGPFPLALWIHGGGWQSCDRRMGGVSHHITGRGFALASVGYRLINDGFPFPAQIHDCIAGLNWLARHADEYSLDMEKIGVFGHSAGAHLSSLLMLTSWGKALFPEIPAPTVRISAGAFWSSVFDLSRKRGFWPEGSTKWDNDSIFCRYFFPKGIYDEDFARWASPASYLRECVQSGMLIVHGDRDELVPFEQARVFAEEVRKSGGQVVFRAALGKGHEMPQDIWMDSVRHFESVLKNQKNEASPIVSVQVPT